MKLAGAVSLTSAALVLTGGCGSTSPPTSPPSVQARLDLSQPWTQANPGEVGMDAQRLALAPAHAAAIGRFRTLLVARHGRMVTERYFGGVDASTLLDVRSVTKSIVSALTGIALSSQALPSLDAPVAPYLVPPYALDELSYGITIRHLLTMTSGFQWDDGSDYNLWITAENHVQYLFDRPHARPAGTQFTYNSAAVHALGVVLQRATGTALPQYADERLFRALGVDTVAWEELEPGFVNGGSGIKLRARDLLKFGQLFLQRGWSGDRSVVPETWVDQTTRPQFPWRDDHGPQRSVTYGMLWWASDASPPAFFAWGYGGQFVYVVPTLDLVVVATTEWQHLTETTPEALAQQVLGVIVGDVLPAAR